MEKRCKEYLKRRYEALRAKGLCVSCGKKPAAPGMCRCAACTRKLSARLKDLYELRRRERLCVSCGRPLKETERFVRCFACRRADAAQHQKRKGEK